MSQLGHPCQADVTTFLACSMPMNGDDTGEGVNAGKLCTKCRL